jgi:hypothetical protein
MAGRRRRVMDSHQRRHSAEVPTALAPDQEELRSLAELVLDEPCEHER